MCWRESNSWFEEAMEWKVGNGSHTRLWRDKWLGEKVIKISYQGCCSSRKKKINVWINLVDGLMVGRFRNSSGGKGGLSGKRVWWMNFFL